MKYFARCQIIIKNLKNGWISPYGIIYSCLPEELEKTAVEICKEQNIEVKFNNPKITLFKNGYMEFSGKEFSYGAVTLTREQVNLCWDIAENINRPELWKSLYQLFGIGNRVKVLGNFTDPFVSRGDTGTIVYYDGNLILVEFDRNIGCPHNQELSGISLCKKGYGRWISGGHVEITERSILPIPQTNLRTREEIILTNIKKIRER